MKRLTVHAIVLVFLLTLNSQIAISFAQGTAFTFQGRLNNSASPVTGAFDFSFSLFNVAGGGSAVAGPVTRSAIGVTNGLFLVTLDFGPGLFTGTNYWLDISVRTNGAATFTDLSPRQPLTPAPYAIMANSASNLLGTLPPAQLGTGTAAVSITGNAAGFTGTLNGDVTGTQSSTVVSKVGGVTAANVASGANAANAATPFNTVAAIMKRDASGSFDAQSASLSGNLILPPTTALVGAIYSSNNLLLHTFGFQNLFAGVTAGNLTMSGSFDTGIGYGALKVNTTGVNDTAVGDGTLFDNTTGYQNTAVGGVALGVNTTGYDNTALGYNAILSNTTGYGNTAAGSGAMQNNTNGTYNTAIGWQALNVNASGIFNTALGEEAMHNNNASFNVAVGGEALYYNTNGNGDTAVGDQALYYNTSGSGNTAVGNQALFQNTTASQNTAIGSGALFANTGGYDNLAVGLNAMAANTNGAYNMASGWIALTANTSGDFNVASGDEALAHNTTGSMNVACGEEALDTVTTSSGNTGIGNQALYYCTGNFNIALGDEAGFDLTTGDNNIDIGAFGNAGEANTIRVGVQGTQTAAIVAGIWGTTASGGVPVYVNSSGQLGTATSSERFKHNIKTMGDASDVLLSLRPVTYNYKPEIDPQGIPQFGLVAEEVNAVDPDLVARDGQGQIYTVRYEAVNAMLLNEFLKQHKTVEEQKTEIDDLKSRLAGLEQLVQTLASKK